MDLKRIKEIVNSGHPMWDELLLMELARDENAFTTMMRLLSIERANKKELITDMNLELSRADIHLRNKSLLKQNQQFIEGEIDKFYLKYKNMVAHCFRNRKKEEVKEDVL